MSASAPKTAQQDYRLPTDVTPAHYDVTIWTDLANSTFEGVVHIEYATPCVQHLGPL